MNRYKFLLFALFSFFVVGELFADKKFASPTGNDSNSGLSKSSPLSLIYAFGENSPLVPGDSLILLDGTYEGNYFLNISGSALKPIRVLSDNEGKAIFDVGKNRTSESAITINGSHVWLIGLHLTSSSTEKREDLGQSVPYEAGITVFGESVKLINCWIYDLAGGGLQLWRPALNLEVYGCLVFNNGTQSTPRGTGHGMYIQHENLDFPKNIRNNIIFQNASQGINFYTSDPANGGIVFSENTSFNTGVIANYNPILFRPPHNLSIGSLNNVSFEIKVSSNVFYSDLQQGRLDKSQVSNVTLGRTYQPNRGIDFIDNLIYGGRNQVEIQPLEKLQFVRNTFFNTHGKFFQFLSLTTTLPQTTWDTNTYYNLIKDPNAYTGFSFSEWKSNSGYDQNSVELETAPEEPKVFIRKNIYDPSLYYVTVINPLKKATVALNFSSFSIPNGAKYELIDFQNPFDPDSRMEGDFSGSSINAPMTWTKSLAPKGNMPHVPLHTDASFGVFQVRFTSESVTPIFKKEITVELDEKGKALTTISDYLENEPQEEWQVEFSRSPEYSCTDIEGTENEIKITDSKGNSWTELVLVKVKDLLGPNLTTKTPNLAFDLTKGVLELKAQDFVTSLTDNCGIKTLELNKTRITCEDYDRPIELVLTAVDLSGNLTSEVLTVSASPFESEKISISPESGTQFLQGQKAEIRLGEEFGFTLIGWYRNGQKIEGEKGKAILTEQSGTYWAKLIPNEGGCEVESQKTEILFSALPFGEVKESITLILGPEGKADLSPSDVFVSWPLTDPTLEIILGKTIFTCEDIGEKIVGILIKNQSGQSWEESIKVVIKDQTAPVLVPKNLSLNLDVTKGVIEITPQMVLESFGDNCGIKTLTISKNRFTCEDIGKEFSISIRAVDNSGNVSEALAKVSVKRLETEKVNLSGPNSLCQGEVGVLKLTSSFPFEVVRWRRNGTEIQGQTGKTLEVKESGVYHAVIRYEGGCLSESNDIEVKVNPLPSGEIRVDGNILRAPEGDFTYQWYRNGEKINGETSRTFTAQLMGDYYVELTSSAGCKVNLAPVTLAISGLLGKPVNEAIDLKIYPNPASDKVTVSFPDGVLAGMPEIFLYSSDGKNVTEAVQILRKSDTEVEIQLNRLAKGTYLIWVIGQDQKTYLGKVIIRN